MRIIFISSSIDERRKLRANLKNAIQAEKDANERVCRISRDMEYRVAAAVRKETESLLLRLEFAQERNIDLQSEINRLEDLVLTAKKTRVMSEIDDGRARP